MKITDDQVKEFEENGVIRIENALEPEDLDPVIEELEEWIDRRAKERLAEGKISDTFDHLGFERRYTELYKQDRELGKGMDIMHSRGRAAFEFLTNKNLLDAIEPILGPEIVVSPIQHIRAKTPFAVLDPSANYTHQGNVPWHQDAGVLWDEADDVSIITCWIPLVDVTEEMGCMEVIPCAHKSGYLEHQSKGDTTILPELMPDIDPVSMECNKGSFIVMDKLTPHHGLVNKTDTIRWSMDLRYQPKDTPTGRPFHPEFVVRSKTDPAGVIASYDEWCRHWKEALENSKGMPAHREKARALRK